MRTRVIFVCSHNSARSQMAEAFLRELGGDRFEAASAGIMATVVHPFAIQAMAEDGIDISLQKSKPLARYLGQPFDLVITVCDEAAEECPWFPNARERWHWSFPDPSRVQGSDEEKFEAFTTVRDAIRDRVERELIRAGAFAA